MSLRGKLSVLGIDAANGAATKFSNGIEAGKSGTEATLTAYPATAAKGKLVVSCADQTGDTAVELNANEMGQATQVNVADPGTAASYMVQSSAAVTLAEANVLDGATAGTQVASKAVVADANVNTGVSKITELHIGATGSETQVTSTAAELNLVDGATVGTQVASKAVIADANINTGVSKVTELHVGATGSEVQVVATPAELNRACDVSARKVSLTATVAITEVLHEGKTCVITGTAAATYTLPEATGSGAIYQFIIAEVNTNDNVITTADATDCSFFGSVNILDLDAAAQAAYAPAATDELMTLNGTTSGGAIGDYIQFIDMATDKWCVFAQLQCPTGSNPATPFSGV